MTPQEQAHAIAKMMDWEYYEDTNEMVATEDGDIIGYSWPSLDAMHEAENTLTGPEAIIYERWLSKFQSRDLTTEPGDRYPKAATVHPWHANARQRCQALIQTRNLRAE
jgi:hypothetical protein